MRTKSSKIKKIIFKVLRKTILTIVLLSVLYNLIFVICSTFNITFSFLGVRFLIVSDGTMRPKLKQNDVIITKNCNESNLEVGNIIVVNKNDSLRIRRITKINANNINSYYITKGDNNYYHDIGEVSIEEIQGELWLRIPKFGIFIKVIQSKIVTAIIIIYIILLYRLNKTMKKKSMQRRKKIKFNN